MSWAITGAPLQRGASMVAGRAPALLASVLPAAVLLAAAPVPARAQFAIDRTELQLHPDVAEARTGVLMVRNEGTQRAQARILVEDWDRAEDGANRFYAAGTLAGSCAPRLVVEPQALLLDPGEAQPVRIRLVGDAAPWRQECWSVVLVESVQPRPAASGRMLWYAVRTGVKVYAAPAALAPEAEVASMMLAPAVATALVATDGPAGGPSVGAPSTPVPSPARNPGGEVQLAVVNRGLRHVTARGRLEVRREDDQVVAAVPLPTVYALPGATRRLAVALPPLARGRYLLLALFDYGGAELTAAQLEVEIP